MVLAPDDGGQGDRQGDFGERETYGGDEFAGLKRGLKHGDEEIVGGDGALIGMVVIITKTARLIIPRGRKMGLSVFCAAARGTTIPSSCGAPFAAGATRRIVTAILGFAAARALISSLIPF